MSLRAVIWLGWGLFSVSAIAFVVAAWRAGDGVALLGAVAFMAANAAFMVAHYRTGGIDD